MDWSIDAKSHGKSGTFLVSSQAALFQGIQRTGHSDSSPINPSSMILWDDFTGEIKSIYSDGYTYLTLFEVISTMLLVHSS